MREENGKERLAADRREQIEQRINSNGSVTVDELASFFLVSPMTIRRDLIQMQRDGKLERCYGGAVAKREITYCEKQINQRDEKIKIAQVCASYIRAEDNIFLDAGTTTYEIAKLIRNRNGIFVATNDLEIARLLSDSKIELFLLGGTLQKETGSVCGNYAIRMLNDLKFDIGFFGTAAINNEFEVMTPTENKMWLKRNALQQCQRSYLAVDATKFGRQAVRKINHLSDYTGIVTNRKFAPAEYSKLKEQGIIFISV